MTPKLIGLLSGVVFFLPSLSNQAFGQAKEKATTLLEMAKQEFVTGEKKEFSKAEHRLMLALESNKIADFSAASEKVNDPANAEGWDKETRTLSVPILVWLCTNKQATALIGNLGINVKGARIDGNLDLSYVKLPFPLTFLNSAFAGEITLINAEVPALNLHGSHTRRVSASGLKADRGVFMGKKFLTLPDCG